MRAQEVHQGSEDFQEKVYLDPRETKVYQESRELQERQALVNLVQRENREQQDRAACLVFQEKMALQGRRGRLVYLV